MCTRPMIQDSLRTWGFSRSEQSHRASSDGRFPSSEGKIWTWKLDFHQGQDNWRASKHFLRHLLLQEMEFLSHSTSASEACPGTIQNSVVGHLDSTHKGSYKVASHKGLAKPLSLCEPKQSLDISYTQDCKDGASCQLFQSMECLESGCS